MKKILKTMTLMAGTVALLVTPSLMVAADVDADMDTAASQKLARAESLAREIRLDAGTVDSLTGFENETHQFYLTRIKTNANDFADIVQSLHQNRGDLEPWQDELVNRILPKLDAMNSDIADAIEYLNSNPEGQVLPVYEDEIDTVYSQANSIVNSIDLYFEWAEGMNAMREIEQS